MSELTLVGLGAMGSAIARTLIDHRCDLTVWNRSADKTGDLAALGATVAESLKQAIEASPRIMVCIHGYAATRALLDDPEIVPLLSGCTVIQMSTGTPAEARDAEAWTHRHGGRYLDCSIMVYPPSIGTAEGQLLVAGSREVYDECAGFIDHLGGDIRYLGATIGAAAALDMALVSRLVANTVAIVYGIHICESEGVPLAEYAGMFPQGDRARHLARVVESGDYEKDIAATVGTSIEAASAIRALAGDLGINTEFPDFILGLYQRASAAGYLDKDNASLIEIFRGKA
ncbi:MAG: NAD(P)-binding domain-containing protein [Gammaproteobacteria bacterium]|nr:NAD(P)-binding domain-containing protein [Gammaproteobacteria bacterium]MDH3858671.1 NAD(P)-binding domain-containing protein [Gammaproteobacteria bacterium]